MAPEQRIDIVATSAFAKNSEETQTLLELIYEHIIDEKGSNTVRPLTDDSVALRQRLVKMAYPVPKARLIPNDIPNLEGQG